MRLDVRRVPEKFPEVPGKVPRSFRESSQKFPRCIGTLDWGSPCIGLVLIQGHNWPWNQQIPTAGVTRTLYRSITTSSTTGTESMRKGLHSPHTNLDS